MRSWFGLPRLALVAGMICTSACGNNGGETTEDPSTGPTATDSTDSTDSTNSTDSTATASTTVDPATTAGTTATTTGMPIDDFDVFELRYPDFAPPKVDTFYSCMSWTFPVEDAVHLVGFRPAVDDPHIHHYVLGVSNEPQNLNPADPCGEWVNNMIWGWAPGGEELWLPDDVGFTAGEEGTVTFVLQVHYNNPLLDDFVDDDGVDVFYTKDLRPNSAGILRFGDISGIVIPPGMDEYEHVAVCPSGLTASLPNELNVVGTWLHAHDIGKRLWTSVYRDGEYVGELGREDPFKFDYQTFQPADFTVQPGDQLETHCVYDSSDRDEPTYGGEGTLDEMCINFLMYYPKIPLIPGCGTA